MTNFTTFNGGCCDQIMRLIKNQREKIFLTAYKMKKFLKI